MKRLAILLLLAGCAQVVPVQVERGRVAGVEQHEAPIVVTNAVRVGATVCGGTPAIAAAAGAVCDLALRRTVVTFFKDNGTAVQVTIPFQNSTMFKEGDIACLAGQILVKCP